MTNSINYIENYYKKKEVTLIEVGDLVSLSYLIPEGNKDRIQRFEGVVIAKKHGGINQTITLRRSVESVGLEQVFLLHSPKLIKVEIKQNSKVRRAKLYYLRSAKGKAAKLTQRF